MTAPASVPKSGIASLPRLDSTADSTQLSWTNGSSDDRPRLTMDGRYFPGSRTSTIHPAAPLSFNGRVRSRTTPAAMVRSLPASAGMITAR
jgi:hypothetical protein